MVVSKRCGVLPAGRLRVSVTLTPGSSPCRRRSPAEDLGGVFHLHFDQRKGVERGSPPQADAEGLGVETGL